MQAPRQAHVEYDQGQSWGALQDTWDEQWQEYSWDTEEFVAAKGKKGKGKRSKSKGKSKEKTHRGQAPLDLPRPQMGAKRDLFPSQSLKPDHARQMVTCSP